MASVRKVYENHCGSIEKKNDPNALSIGVDRKFSLKGTIAACSCNGNKGNDEYSNNNGIQRGSDDPADETGNGQASALLAALANFGER